MERNFVSGEHKTPREQHFERMRAAARELAREAESGSALERAFREYATERVGQADVMRIAEEAGLTYADLTRIIRARADGPQNF